MLPAQNETLSAKVFETEVKVLIGAIQGDGMVPVSARLPNTSAFQRFLAYDAHTSIISVADQEEFRRFLKECRGRRTLAFMILRAVLAVPIYVIDFISGLIRGILGSFIGFGLIGILIVIVAIVLSLMIGLYAFIIAAPFVVASAGLNYYEEKVYRDAGRSFLSQVVGQLREGWHERAPVTIDHADQGLLPAGA